METKRTNKEILIKGLKKMAISLIMMFAGPTLFFIATTNKEKPLYVPILVISLLICAGAVFLAFKGLQTIMNSMFDKKS
jgi:predicted permease